ncbi:TetR family transcriptional regulator [Chloroflexi bacterium TSY]|nr:TetR family transcriptional regulator [Chloroflexi bacterium TSY]
MKRTADEAAETRSAILDAALSVFGQSGYHAARLKDISDQAGVTRGAIYHHFENKLGLYQALRDAANSLIQDKIIPQAIAEGGPFLDILERIIVRTLVAIEEDKRLQNTMRLDLSQSDFSGELEPIAEMIRESAVTEVNNVASFFEMAIQQGAIRADIEPAIIARALLAFQNGMIRIWLVNPDAFSLKADAPQLARLFLSSIAVEGGK